jgi:hypothetical protein
MNESKNESENESLDRQEYALKVENEELFGGLADQRRVRCAKDEAALYKKKSTITVCGDALKPMPSCARPCGSICPGPFSVTCPPRSQEVLVATSEKSPHAFRRYECGEGLISWSGFPPMMPNSLTQVYLSQTGEPDQRRRICEERGNTVPRGKNNLPGGRRL